MSKLTAAAKQEWARLLYIHEKMTQKEIAAKTKVTEATLTRWKKNGSWDRLRTSISVSKDEELKRIYLQMKALNDAIADSDIKYADTKQADILSKLAASAKTLETETSMKDVIDTFREFTEFIRGFDFEKAQELVELQDSFIKHKLSHK